jgi:hypothetical protein
MSIRQSEPVGWPLGARSGDASIEADAVFFEQRIVRETPVAREVFDDHQLVLRDDVPADGNIARGLARLGKIRG